MLFWSGILLIVKKNDDCNIQKKLQVTSTNIFGKEANKETNKQPNKQTTKQQTNK